MRYLFLVLFLSGCSFHKEDCVLTSMTEVKSGGDTYQKSRPALTYEQALKVCGVK